jgi:hypothetical protein
LEDLLLIAIQRATAKAVEIEQAETQKMISEMLPPGFGDLGSMFGPWGMAAGASIGLVSSAISGLIEKQKQLKAVSEATFKSSTDVATFFGNAVVDTTLKVGAFSTVMTGLGNSANKTAQSFGFTNEELARFNDLIQSLPEGNPLKTVIEGLADEDNPAKINEIAKAFITTQVAMGQLKPDQAQKTLDLILASSGHLAMVGSSFINLTTQVQAISLTLQSVFQYGWSCYVAWRELKPSSLPSIGGY